MWFRKTRTNAANQSNKIKGGITISNESSGVSDIESLVLDKILNKLESIDNKVDNNTIQINKINDCMKTHKKAFKIYVENNGVKTEVKKIISKMLKD